MRSQDHKLLLGIKLTVEDVAKRVLVLPISIRLTYVDAVL